MRNEIDLWSGAWANPTREIDRMRSTLERMFDRLPKLTKPTGENGLELSPACEVSEDENQYLLKFDLPGIPKDQVKIELNNNQLTVSAERKEEKSKDTKRLHLEELSYGSYMRSFSLPTAVDEKKVEAKFENGVLTVTIPKIESSKPKQIAIH